MILAMRQAVLPVPAFLLWLALWFEEGRDKFGGVEHAKVLGLLADTNIPDWKAEAAGNGEYDAALGRAVELGDGNACQPDSFMELHCLVQRVLACARIHHQHDFMGRVSVVLLHHP